MSDVPEKSRSLRSRLLIILLSTGLLIFAGLFFRQLRLGVALMQQVGAVRLESQKAFALRAQLDAWEKAAAHRQARAAKLAAVIELLADTDNRRWSMEGGSTRGLLVLQKEGRSLGLWVKKLEPPEASSDLRAWAHLEDGRKVDLGILASMTPEYLGMMVPLPDGELASVSVSRVVRVDQGEKGASDRDGAKSDPKKGSSAGLDEASKPPPPLLSVELGAEL